MKVLFVRMRSNKCVFFLYTGLSSLRTQKGWVFLKRGRQGARIQDWEEVLVFILSPSVLFAFF
jgi:hypothetical protein